MDHQSTLNRLIGVFERRVFFIVGLTRPGTAWLQHAIDAHPEACCRGEGHFTDSLLPLMGRALAGYNKAIQDRRQDHLISASAGPGRGFGFSNDEVFFLMATAITLSLANQATGDDVLAIGEKTPEHVLAIEALAAVMPQAKFIHVIRDGRDEAVAVYDHNRRTGNRAFLKKYPGLADFTQDFGRNWTRAVGLARAFGRRQPDRYLEIRSEDLFGEAATDLARLCRFLGLDDGDDAVSRCAAAGRRGVGEDGDGGVIGHWRERFDEPANTAFARSGGELLKLLDYQ